MKKIKKSSGVSKHVTKKELVRELSTLELKIDAKIEKSQKELMHYMDIKNEVLLSDFRDMFSDRTAQHDDKLANHEHRLKRIEHKVGLAI